MRTSRAILTLTIVAAVLCADRVATAAADARPQVVETARLVAQRLTAGIRRHATVARLDRPLAANVLIDSPKAARIIQASTPPGPTFSLVQLPLPPPAV
jgi:hypothetical protein